MPTVIRNIFDDTVLHENTLSEKDFERAEVTEKETTLCFPQGEMELKGWYFDGIRIGYSRLTLKQQVELEWDNDLDVVHLHFNLGGKMKVVNQQLEQTITYGHLQHNISYQNGFKGVMRYEELHNSNFIIQFNKQRFIQMVEGMGERLVHFGEMIADDNPAVLSGKEVFIDLNMLSAIDAIMKCTYTGGTKKMFLQAKCMELLVLQAAAMERAEEQQFVYCKTEYDKERILFARDYLIQHCDLPPTLPELARIAGINEFKLKKGFKEMFNHTVNGYLFDYKMNLAQNELSSGKTASQIAYDLGYSSLQHFSTAFKRKFGYGPSNFQH